MARWRPGARERLQSAALDRFVEQGFERTTVAEIAASAGLTERTFFRHFTDKREALFAGQDEFEDLFLTGLAGSDERRPLGMVVDALAGADVFFLDDRRARSRARQAVIDAVPSLQERELLKLAALVTTLTGALRARGVDATAAALAAETGVAVFRIAFATWIADGETRSLAAIRHDVLAELPALVDAVPTAVAR